MSPQGTGQTISIRQISCVKKWTDPAAENSRNLCGFPSQNFFARDQIEKPAQEKEGNKGQQISMYMWFGLPERIVRHGPIGQAFINAGQKFGVDCDQNAGNRATANIT